MRDIPRPALILGIAGVLPFAALALAPLYMSAELIVAGARFSFLIYTQTILAFMSGCIWAFAAKTEDSLGYALSTVPALFGFFVLAGTLFLGRVPPFMLPAILAVGFLALLILDARAARFGQTPPWWMPLRYLLTALVVGFLIIGALV